MARRDRQKKKVAVIYLGYYAQICLEGMTETTQTSWYSLSRSAHSVRVAIATRSLIQTSEHASSNMIECVSSSNVH